MSNLVKNYYSLYDYLGFPAGNELGKRVWSIALKGNIPVCSRYIKNKNYEGRVLLYPFDFIDDYFETYPEDKINPKSLPQ